MKIVNDKGRAYIVSVLKEYHINFKQKDVKASVISAWCDEVEQHLLDGYGPYFELSEYVSKSGWPEVFTLTEDMLDTVGNDEDEED